MTKEELKQEAEEWLCNNLHSASEEDFIKAIVDIAEPREKRIAELEKRCANYEMNISKMEKGTCDICKETEKDKKILELEKENAELKHIIATLRQEKDNVSMHAKAMEVVAKTRSDQLTKAKELLKRFIELENCTLDYDDIKEAEQFLKENE